MPRPVDWSPLGLSGDPTPGDPEALVAVADFMHTMAGHAQTADTGLTQVVAKSGEGAFVGKTADWLRDTISTAIRDFVGGVRTAFQQTEPAVRSYISALREAQSRADAALTEATGLAADDPRRTTLAADANQAGTDLKTAAGTAATTIREAREHIRSPNPKKSACEVFWEIFGWIVLAITVVAIFVGGPLGLIALGLNAIMATKALVDFASGKTNVTGLVLGLLGLLGPSTKPLIALSTLRTITGATTKILKGAFTSAGVTIAKVGNGFWQTISTITFSAAVKGVGEIGTTLANSVRAGSTWVFKAFTTADGLAVRGFVTLKNFVVTGPAATAAFIRSIASVAGGLPAALAASVRAVPGFARGLGGWSINAVRSVGRVLSNQFGGWKWLKIFLPLNGVEIGILGVQDAFRLAVLGRGLVQTNRYAGLAKQVDLVTAAGGALRVSDGILRGVNPPEPGLARTDSGLFVPEKIDGFSAFSGDVGGGVSVKPLDALGQNGRIVTPGSPLPDLNLSVAGRDLGAPNLDPVSPVRSDLDLSRAVLLEPGKLAATPPGGQLTASHLPADTMNLLGDTNAFTGANPLAGSHSLTTANPLGGISPAGGADLGDLTAPARLAVHHAGDMPATGFPEIRAALGGDLTAVQISDTQVAFNLGAADDGMVLPGHTFDAPQMPATSHAALSNLTTVNGALPNLTTSHAALPNPAAVNGALVNGALPNGALVNGALPNPAAVHPSVPAAHGAANSTVVAQPARTELLIGTNGVEIRGAHDVPAPVNPAPHSGELGRPSELAGLQSGAFDTVHTGDLGMTARSVDGRPGPSGQVNQSVHSALDLLAPPPAPGPHTPVADAVSARSVDPALAGVHGPPLRPDTAGMPNTAGMPASAASRAGGDVGTRLVGQAGGDTGGDIGRVLDDFTRVSAQVRLARENLEIARLSGGSDPLADAQKVARAEKNLRVVESVQSKIAAGLQARGVDDPFAAAADHAWTEFRIAQHQLTEARAVHDGLHPDPGTRPFGEGTSAAGSGKGKAVATPAQLDAGVNLENAAVRFDAAQDRLDDLGLDATRLQAADDEALRLSLLERPRLLGGMRPTDVRQLGADGVVHGYGRPLAGGLHLNLDVPPPGGAGAAHAGTEPGAIVDGAGAVVFRGEVTELGHGGFRIADPTDAGLFREFNATGHLTGAGLDVHAGGLPTGRLEIDLVAGTGRLHRPGQAVPGQFGYQPLPGGGHQITSLADGSWHRYDAAGGQTAARFDIQDATGQPAGRLETDLAAGTATLHRPGQAVPVNVTYHPRPGGGHQITNPADNSWHRFDPAGNHIGSALGVRDSAGAAGGRLEIDVAAGTATLHRPGQAAPDNFTYQPLPGGAHQITSLADGSSLRFDLAGNQTGAGLDVHGPAGAAGGRLEIDLAAGTATLHRPGQPAPDDFTYQPLPGGEHQITNAADGSWHRYDAAGNQTGARFDVADHGGNPFGSVEIDIGAGTGRHISPGGARRDWPTLQIEPGGNIRLSNAAGEVQRYAPGGGLVDEIIAPRDPQGNIGPSRIHTGLDPAGNRVLELRHGNAPVPNTRVTVDGGDYRITNTGRGPHGGDYQVIGHDGALRAERISVLTRPGRADGTHLSVDYRTNQWTRLDAAGAQLTGHGNAAPRAGLTAGQAPPPVHGYNSRGAVTVKANGDLQLVGGDRTPFYTRETLGDGNGHPRPTLEVFRGGDGRRYWHQWSGSADGTLGASAGRGTRAFQDLPEGRLWSDHRHGWPTDRVVREYRRTADGGVIRAEAQADGSWHWYRFDADGRLTLDGVRDHQRFSTSWRDTYTAADGRQVVAQRYNSAFNLFPKALHYQEYTVVPTPGGGFRTTDAYKEFSPQIKDTGTLDTLGNGNALKTTRWAEQRPPDSLWKTPAGMPGRPVGKAVSYVAGSKLGAVDFPTPGRIRGDTRYQVFKWTETDAHGAEVATGVRAITPDGSFSDFTREGLFVRGAIKLENGNTVEIGRAADGKWASLEGNLPAPGPRSLAWREIDSAKRLVSAGERHFLTGGKHWVDGTPNGAPAGQLRVVRHTDAGGNVVHTVGQAHRPLFDPAAPPAAGPFAPQHLGETVTRNTMGQIVGRQEQWLSDQPLPVGRAQPAPITVRAGGDARTGRWTWDDGTSTGIRTSSRNERWSGSWDDSYRDFRAVGDVQHQIRDVRALGRGTSLVAQRMPDGTWQSVIRGIDGTPVPNSAATRQFARADGTWPGNAPTGTGHAPWRDVDANGHVLRELVDGRVREYTNPRPANAPNGSGAWKEFDQGAVFRERVDKGGGVYRETEHFHKQWRETDANGRLLSYRSLSGTVWERGPLNRWSVQHRNFSLVGREFEFRGAASEFRGKNRMWRESNRLQFKAIDGLAGEFVSPTRRILQKAALDFGQEFLLDFSAQVLLALAFNQGQLNPQDWFRALVGAGIASGIKTGNSMLHDSSTLRLKGFKDGLANVDGGKDYNRNPYNHDKHWDNEWGGTENPPRWRQSTYDYFQSTIAVNFVSAFVANAVNAAAFGLPKEYVPMAGGHAALAGAWGGAGTLIVSSTIGGARTLAHQLSSGRYFHRGGAIDIGLSFVERLGERAMGTYLLLTAAGLRPQDNLSAPPPVIVPPAPPPP